MCLDQHCSCSCCRLPRHLPPQPRPMPCALHFCCSKLYVILLCWWSLLTFFTAFPSFCDQMQFTRCQSQMPVTVASTLRSCCRSNQSVVPASLHIHLLASDTDAGIAPRFLIGLHRLHPYLASTRTSPSFESPHASMIFHVSISSTPMVRSLFIHRLPVTLRPASRQHLVTNVLSWCAGDTLLLTRDS
jgi:hypothetical protein